MLRVLTAPTMPHMTDSLGWDGVMLGTVVWRMHS
jgi:hypothetical protein